MTPITWIFTFLKYPFQKDRVSDYTCPPAPGHLTPSSSVVFWFPRPCPLTSAACCWARKRRAFQRRDLCPWTLGRERKTEIHHWAVAAWTSTRQCCTPSDCYQICCWTASNQKETHDEVYNELSSGFVHILDISSLHKANHVSSQAAKDKKTLDTWAC